MDLRPIHILSCSATRRNSISAPASEMVWGRSHLELRMKTILVVLVLTLNGQGTPTVDPVFVRKFTTEQACVAAAVEANSHGSRAAVCVPEVK